jgi:DNA-nicking Smr family endonuclease
VTRAKPIKVQGLDELSTLRDALRAREKAAAEAAARHRAARAAAERQRQLFATSVGPVTPLPAHGLAPQTVKPPEPLPRQREADELAALQEALSDEVDIHRSGVGPDVVTRLRRGHWSIQGELDLHGLRREEARDELAGFMKEASRRGWRCLRVVHGKGLGSPGRQPVLKAKVQRWLGQHDAVLAFTQASAPQGGAGALIVLLRG